MDDESLFMYIIVTETINIVLDNVHTNLTVKSSSTSASVHLEVHDNYEFSLMPIFSAFQIFNVENKVVIK